MRIKFLLLLIISSFQISIIAQKSIDSIHQIEEVIIKTQRIKLPLSEKSQTISILSSNQIDQMPVKTLDEVLQRIVGVDIRRRGIDGMQSDIYIRGGNFNQVLLLIDGVKMDDLQTGHHTMNGSISLENIERIEVIKGAAARIYGVNAMNGAVNIVTKKISEDLTKITLNTGAYENFGIGIGFQKLLEKGSVQFHIKRQQSDGYRFNTDFENWNFFLKSSWKDYELLFSYSQRDFGANGFYASPNYKDQYEETQTHLVSLKRTFKNFNWQINTNAYWRRNQDMYLFLRHDPDYYRNLHINNKIGFSVDVTYNNELGQSGIGIDINQGLLTSNNLGDHNRFTSTIFLEHRFQWFDNRLDVTPGFAVAYYSDFKEFGYPGVDIGYRFSKSTKIYANLGYTSRIPSYTNLFYESSIEQGNPDLKPEKAFTYEGGVYYTKDNFHINATYFNRKSTDLIDWTKEFENDKWEARNFSEIQTNGIEFQGNIDFIINDFSQNFSLGYTYMDDRILDQIIVYSRYSLNSYKHQFSGQLKTQLFSFLQQHISYRYSERADETNYQLVDVAINFYLKKWELNFKVNNIFGVEYTEANLVPMPKANFMLATSFSF